MLPAELARSGRKAPECRKKRPAETFSIHLASQHSRDLANLFDKFAELFRQNGLHAVRKRLVGLVVHFDQQSIRAHGNRRARKRQDFVPFARFRAMDRPESARWLRFLTAGTTAKSSVLREKSENVRTPRSHSITL